MKPIVIGILILSAFPNRSEASYRPLRLFEAFCSDLIVQGEIVDVGDSTFTVGNLGILAGNV